MFANILLTLLLFFQISPTNIFTESQQSTSSSGHFSITNQKAEFPRKKADSQSLGVRVSAKSAAVLDSQSGKVLFEKNMQQSRSLASLTKLMTALVVLDNQPDWDKVVEIKNEDQAEGARLFVNAGEKVTTRDLFYSTLVGSANNAVKALARSTGLTEKEFVAQMNDKARQLGMNQTNFVDPTGLDPDNQSTALDIATLARYAFERTEIVDALLMDKYSFYTADRRQLHTIENTDKLIDSFLNDGINFKLLGGKTGYLEEAKYCLVNEVADQEGHKIIVVILGSQSSETRFQEMKGLVWWTFENYEWE